jgi:serine protease AprX
VALAVSSLILAAISPLASAAKGSPGELWDVARRISADKLDATGYGVQIAFIDTGVVDVPGLRYSNVILGPDFSFEDQIPELRARDTNGHGTHLAGIMVASDAEWIEGDHRRKSGRTLGIAPDAELVSIKVGAADGSVDVTQVIAAINWVVENKDAAGFNIRIINLAYGTDGTQDYRIDPLAYAVERAWHAGIVVVVAAGNSGAAGGLVNPALDPYVIAVGGAEAGQGWQDAVAAFSSDSDSCRRVDIVAPGASIVSLRNSGSFSDLSNESGRVGDDLVRGSGTSQASAVVSASVALLLELHPNLTPDQVKAALMEGSDKIKDSDKGRKSDKGSKSDKGRKSDKSDECNESGKDGKHSKDGKGHKNESDSPAIGYLDVNDASHAATKGKDVANAVQTWERSTGTGSIAASRGSHVLLIDGVPLAGEMDIFGNSWTGNSWTDDSWTGNSWTGNSWTGNSWTGNSWTGNSWTGNSWTGNSWTGNSWTGNSWTGNSWTGNSWTGNSWTGNSWTGNSWTGNSWSDL